MAYEGDIRLEDTIDIKFTSRQISGAPFTLAGSPVISAYIGNSTTQLTAGITLTTDFDGVTGLNNVRVVATSANGYTASTNIQLVITTGTVNSVSVAGEVIASFSIEARSALMPATPARKAVVDAAGLIDSNMVKAGPTGSGTAQTAYDIGGKLGAPAGASHAADIAAVKVDTAAVKVQTDKFVFSVANQVDSNVIDWKGATAPAMTGDAYAVVNSGTFGNSALKTLIDAIKTVVDAVNAKTTNLPSDPADESAIEAAILAALNMATIPEPTGIPSATPTIIEALATLIMMAREKVIVDSNTGKKTYHNSANTGLTSKTLTDAAGIYTETKLGAP